MAFTWVLDAAGVELVSTEFCLHLAPLYNLSGFPSDPFSNYSIRYERGGCGVIEKQNVLLMRLLQWCTVYGVEWWKMQWFRQNAYLRVSLCGRAFTNSPSTTSTFVWTIFMPQIRIWEKTSEKRSVGGGPNHENKLDSPPNWDQDHCELLLHSIFIFLLFFHRLNLKRRALAQWRRCALTGSFTFLLSLSVARNCAKIDELELAADWRMI